MLPWISGAGGGWMEDDREEEEQEALSWARAADTEAKDELALAGFKSMLEEEWYLGSSGAQQAAFDSLHAHGSEMKELGFPSNPSTQESLLLNHNIDTPSSSSPPSVFHLDPTHHFLPSKTSLSTLLGSSSSVISFDTDFDLCCDAPVFLPGAQISNSPVLMGRVGGEPLGFPQLGSSAQIGGLDPSSGTVFQSTYLQPGLLNSSGVGIGFNPMGSEGFESSQFITRAKILRPLEIFPSVGAQPTLFQKRAAALRRNSNLGGEKVGSLRRLGLESAKGVVEEESEKRRIGNEEEEIEEGSIDGSGLNYDSDENGKGEKSGRNGGVVGGNGSNGNSTVTGSIVGDTKGKKKGLPAKNLMAERRRRKKLNDRLYMLRSMVPKICKVS